MIICVYVMYICITRNFSGPKAPQDLILSPHGQNRSLASYLVLGVRLSPPVLGETTCVEFDVTENPGVKCSAQAVGIETIFGYFPSRKSQLLAEPTIRLAG